MFEEEEEEEGVVGKGLYQHLEYQHEVSRAEFESEKKLIETKSKKFSMNLNLTEEELRTFIKIRVMWRKKYNDFGFKAPL